jgi:hypothetical protein
VLYSVVLCCIVLCSVVTGRLIALKCFKTWHFYQLRIKMNGLICEFVSYRYVCVCTCMYVLVRSVYVCIMYVCTYEYVHMYVCTYVCMYVFLYSQRSKFLCMTDGVNGLKTSTDLSITHTHTLILT